MFNKKITLILMTLVFMLSMSAVAAVDSNSTDDMIANDVDEEPPSGDLDISSTDETDTGVDEEPDYSLSGSNLLMYYKNGSSYQVTLLNGDEPVVGAEVRFTINNATFVRVTDDSGVASLRISLNPNMYDVSASYGNASVKNKIKVLPVIIGKDVTKTYNGGNKYLAKFLDAHGKPLSNTNVRFILKGKTYVRKTNANGVAYLQLSLPVGNHVIYAVHPNGYKISNNITVKSSITAYDITKYYQGPKKFCAIFYGKNGEVLKYKYIRFYAKKTYFYVKTDGKGIARLGIISTPSVFNVVSINPVTGEKKTNKVTVKSTLYASSVTTYSNIPTKFQVTLYRSSGVLAKNVKMNIYVAGSKKTVQTDSNGVATLNFKLAKGTYIFKSVDPYTGYALSRYVYVNLATVEAHDIAAIANQSSTFTAILYNSDGSFAKNTDMQITIGTEKYTVKTNSKGQANVNFNLEAGTYIVSSKDLRNGFTLHTKLFVVEYGAGHTYSKYGVSDDGKTILAIGRPSAANELSIYGYQFYMVELDRTCPYCGSHELYWDIFFAGSETTNYGIFPATGNGEGSSAEGIIVCANCDSDWSIFGHNHGGSGGNLRVLVSPVKTTKEVAYILKSGNYVRL